MTGEKEPLEHTLEPEFSTDLDGHYARIKKTEGEESANAFVTAVHQAFWTVLADNPYLGDSFERELRGLRRIRIDHPDHMGKPRYRLVYELLPDDGAPGLAHFWGVVPRGSAVGYSQIRVRLRSRRDKETG